MYRFRLWIWPLVLVGGILVLTSIASAAVPIPQIYKVVPSQDNSYRPWVTGLTPNEVEVEILMDDVPQGMAKVVTDESGTASFGWSPQQDLPVGWHEFRVRGKYGENYSLPGGILGFTIKHPTPAPILEEPTQSADHILIKGLVKNGLAVKIYIDDIQVADFSVPNHPSGTTNFWFKARGLLNGLHEVYVVAYDDTDKLSKFSDVKSFKTEQQKITKGDDEEMILATEPITETEAQVVDAKVEGKVAIVEPTREEFEVVVVADEEDGKVMVTKEENKEDGEVSSIEEVSETVLISEEVDGFDREQRNRTIGLVILGIMVIILLGWYLVEKKNTDNELGKKETDSNKIAEKVDEKDKATTDEVDKIDDLGL